MKPATEMHEGPEGHDGFMAAIKTIIKVPKSAMPPSPFKKAATKSKKPAGQKG